MKRMMMMMIYRSLKIAHDAVHQLVDDDDTAGEDITNEEDDDILITKA